MRPRASRSADAFSLGLQSRLRKVLSLVPALRSGDDPETVHDIRVWSRRLQQGLDAVFPKPRPRLARKARRRLRRLRRALGEWRNLDVVFEMVAARRRRTRDRARRRAWGLVARELRGQRRQEIERARQAVSGVDLRALEELVTRLVEQARNRRPGSLRPAVAEALDDWNGRIASARDTRHSRDLHALRIATKRLRYRAELARDLGDPPPAGALRWMKDLQDRLGSWHDREVLRDRVAAALARPEVLLEEPEALRAALTDLKREGEAEVAEIDGILHHAGDPAVPAALRHWIES